MVSLTCCASCGRVPRVRSTNERREWAHEIDAPHIERGARGRGREIGQQARIQPSAAAATTAKEKKSKQQQQQAFWAFKKTQEIAPTVKTKRKDAVEKKGSEEEKKEDEKEEMEEEFTWNAPSLHRSVFSKLTDPSLYTGSHRHRFDSSGRGVGLLGRDSIAKGMGSGVNIGYYGEGTVVSLAQLVRNRNLDQYGRVKKREDGTSVLHPNKKKSIGSGSGSGSGSNSESSTPIKRKEKDGEKSSRTLSRTESFTAASTTTTALPTSHHPTTPKKLQQQQSPPRTAQHEQQSSPAQYYLQHTQSQPQIAMSNLLQQQSEQQSHQQPHPSSQQPTLTPEQLLYQLQLLLTQSLPRSQPAIAPILPTSSATHPTTVTLSSTTAASTSTVPIQQNYPASYSVPSQAYHQGVSYQLVQTATTVSPTMQLNQQHQAAPISSPSPHLPPHHHHATPPSHHHHHSFTHDEPIASPASPLLASGSRLIPSEVQYFINNTNANMNIGKANNMPIQMSSYSNGNVSLMYATPSASPIASPDQEFERSDSGELLQSPS